MTSKRIDLLGGPVVSPGLHAETPGFFSAVILPFASWDVPSLTNQKWTTIPSLSQSPQKGATMKMTASTPAHHRHIAAGVPVLNDDLNLGERTGSMIENKANKTNQEIEVYKAKIQALTRELLRTEEAERERIASELHDHIGQDLLFLKLRLQALFETPRNAEIDKSGQQLIEILDGAIRKTREMTTNLNLQVLSELGLEEAIGAFIDKIRMSSTIRFSFDVNHTPVEASPIAQALIYRGVCELIINAVKHSEAANLIVAIGQTNEWLRAVVRDDGIGFAATGGLASDKRGKGCGLTGIRERVSGIGGDMEICSYPGEMTEVIIRVPRYIE